MLLASILFGVSVYGVLSSRNLARVLISAEIMFNAFVLYILGYLTAVYSVSPGAVAYVSSLVVMAVVLAVSEIVVSFSILLAVVRFGVLRRIDSQESIVRDLSYEGGG